LISDPFEGSSVGFSIQWNRTGEHQMTEGAKLVTSKPDIEDRECAEEPADTNRPVALVGVSHQHLENQQGRETKSEKSNKNDEE
jgi:hypothetical protein